MSPTDALLARKGAILVKWGFEKYRSGFRRITRRSALHFEFGDWHGVQVDIVDRLALYTNVVRRVVAALEEVFGPFLGDRLKVRVAAAPEKGAANQELIAFLARTLDLPKSAFHLQGAASRSKTVEIRDLSPELADRLASLAPPSP